MSHPNFRSHYDHLFSSLSSRLGEILGTPNFGIHRGYPMDPWSICQNKRKIDFWKRWKNLSFHNPPKVEYCVSTFFHGFPKSRWHVSPKKDEKNTKMWNLIQNGAFLWDAASKDSKLIQKHNNLFFSHNRQIKAPLQIYLQSTCFCQIVSTCFRFPFGHKQVTLSICHEFLQ